jgi:hypothetical protein
LLEQFATMFKQAPAEHAMGSGLQCRFPATLASFKLPLSRRRRDTHFGNRSGSSWCTMLTPAGAAAAVVYAGAGRIADLLYRLGRPSADEVGLIIRDWRHD